MEEYNREWWGLWQMENAYLKGAVATGSSFAGTEALFLVFFFFRH
jgi:hypothetical protein